MLLHIFAHGRDLLAYGSGHDLGLTVVFDSDSTRQDSSVELAEKPLFPAIPQEVGRLLTLFVEWARSDVDNRT